MKKIAKRVSLLDFVVLGTILIVALSARLYKINTPLADLHSWRQVDTAAVSRNFVKTGFDLLHPRYDDLSSIQTGIENPNGYRMVEFPFYNAVVAIISLPIPWVPIEVVGRAVTAFFSLIIIAVLYALVRQSQNTLTAGAVGLVYAIFPFFVFMSRTVLPETTALMCACVAIYLLSYSQNHRHGFLLTILGGVFFALGMLVKPMIGFYLLPCAVILFQKHSFSFWKRPSVYLFFLISLIPFGLWRMYIANYPEGIPASSWLFAYVNTFEGQKNILFKPAFFRWIFFERIGLLMFGGLSAGIAFLGLVQKKSFILHSVILASFIYLFTFQGGNVQHEYYQTIAFPGLAIAAGFGFSMLLQKDISKFLIHPILRYPLVGLILILSIAFSYYRVKDYYGYPQDLVSLAQVIKTLTKPTDKIVVDRIGDTTLLYLADRKGSPAPYKSLPEFKKDGYRFFVTQKKEVVEQIKKETDFRVVFENTEFAIIQL